MNTTAQGMGMSGLLASEGFRTRGRAWRALALVSLLLALISRPAALATDVTEGNLRGAILGRLPATTNLDVNGDGRLDVADLVAYARAVPVLSFAAGNSTALESAGVVFDSAAVL